MSLERALPSSSERTTPAAELPITIPPTVAAPSDAELADAFEKTRRVVRPGLQTLSGAIISFRALTTYLDTPRKDGTEPGAQRRER